MRQWWGVVALVGTVGASAAPVAAGAQVLYLTASLSGDQERPSPTGSTGTGFGSLWYSPLTGTIRTNLSVANLIGTTVGVGPGGGPAHIHIINSAVGNGPIVVPITAAPVGVTGFPNVMQTFTFASLAAIGVSSANLDLLEDELNSLIGAAPGTASDLYYNVHTTRNPGGEIRGDLVVSAVPEPSTYALMAGGLLVLGGIVRRRQQA